MTALELAKEAVRRLKDGFDADAREYLGDALAALSTPPRNWGEAFDRLRPALETACLQMEREGGKFARMRAGTRTVIDVQPAASAPDVYKAMFPSDPREDIARILDKTGHCDAAAIVRALTSSEDLNSPAPGPAGEKA